MSAENTKSRRESPAGAGVVSVVVPVYNVEKYLPRCLRSLAEQTAAKRLEIVLVDDGSTDASGRICDEFARAHENARVLHRQNGGVSRARNAGIEAASGEYVAFVDGDDFLRRDAMETALSHLRAGAQAVFFRMAEVRGDEEAHPASSPETLLLEGPEVHRALLTHRNGILENAPKIYRRDAIGAARFPEDIRIGEDAVFLFRVLQNVRRAVIPGPALYFYRVHSASSMHTLRPELLDERIRAHEEVERLTCETWPELAAVAQARTLFMRIFILNDLMDCPDMGDAACFRRHLGALRRNLGALMKNRERVWLPPSRKAYALVLCACPGAARLLHRRRVEKRRRKG